MHDTIRRNLVRRMLGAKILDFRDVANGEEPFVYSTGNKGPIYLMVKGLVSQRPLLRALIHYLAIEVLGVFPDVEYVAGNVTGGVIPGWELAEALSTLTAREIPYVYVRDTRKVGGQGEQITGDANNNFFVPGRRGLVVEELVNYAQTTTNSAIVQRAKEYDARHAATILSYDQPEAEELLAKHGVRMIALFKLLALLEIAVAAGADKQLVGESQEFIVDPAAWQRKYGFTPKEVV